MEIPIVSFIQNQLLSQANPNNAQDMARYMKTTMPFHGVKATNRKLIAKQALKKYPIKTLKEYKVVITALWNQSHREEKYIAIDIARTCRTYTDLEVLPLFERMIREGAWWDLVDEIAYYLIGSILSKHPDVMWPIIEAWNNDPHLWIRRTSILCQNRFKQQTDENRLFKLCLQRAHEKDFFMRKAIGWALREYAKVNPQRVRLFLTQHKTRLSPLSYKEAARQL